MQDFYLIESVYSLLCCGYNYKNVYALIKLGTTESQRRILYYLWYGLFSQGGAGNIDTETKLQDIYENYYNCTKEDRWMGSKKRHTRVYSVSIK